MELKTILRDEEGKFIKGSHVKTEFKKGNIGYWTGKHLTEETKQKLSEAHKGQTSGMKGKHHTEKAKEKMKKTQFKIGHIPWTKGLKGHNKGHIGYMLGKKHSLETRRKISEANKGEKAPRWKGGVTPLILTIGHSFKSRQWRSDVFTRDNFTCQECGIKGGYLNTRHIKSFSSILQYYEITTIKEALECEELWNINNGVTLCKKCHRELHKKLRAEEKE